jgi:hypothetical protein
MYTGSGKLHSHENLTIYLGNLTKFNEGIRTRDCFYLLSVDFLELLLQIFQVLVCQFLWVGLFAHRQIANATFNDVAVLSTIKVSTTRDA